MIDTHKILKVYINVCRYFTYIHITIYNIIITETEDRTKIESIFGRFQQMIFRHPQVKNAIAMYSEFCIEVHFLSQECM